ncbi:MAG: hypothetical protein HN981_02805 [Candidatus Pacebacteria bacterium]|jgi:hypothetical protein|nr:hypothetical protein [Candidatus Paceibacterota bacterium]MBT4652579.1 hypothetical protein [Candidatus Paceibacterota bacterium]MBT6756406.1 hypothetical protein [Candidatus Paceibacterota bacterium]MBT6921300.1 hypothetical protein [Candidatus Paceibacterota bacterium]
MSNDLFSQFKPKTRKKTKKKVGFEAAGTLFDKFKLKDKGGYITQEFQDFGYRLAIELDDLKRVGLYMRMAKLEKRAILERALSFISDSNARSKSRLFMWKVKQLKLEKEQGEVDNKKKKTSKSNGNKGIEKGLF